MAKTSYSAPLLAAAKAGDEAAILLLLKQSQPEIRRYARRSCRSDHVDDATQDALLALQRSIGGLRSFLAFSGWLFQVVRHACLKQARRAFNAHLPLEAVENDFAVAHRSEADLRLDIAAALQSLPDHYRIIILLRDVEEFSISEIAATLQLSREAVKARLHRARKLVREYLSDEILAPARLN